MTTIDIRKKLHNFVADTDDNRVEGIYLMLKDEIDKTPDFKLSPHHKEILNEEREAHLKGLSISYTQKEAREFITGITKNL